MSSHAVAQTASDSYAWLLEQIRAKKAVVGVVGLGYVGLPFAVQSARSGFATIGFDVSVEKVDQVNLGYSYIGDVPSALIQEALDSRTLGATHDLSRLGECDVIVVAVPTPLTKNLVPDLGAVESTTRAIAAAIRPGQLVTLESTTYPGTTEEIMLPILEESGLVLNRDFFLAHSPERVDPGNHQFHTQNTTKVVGGVGERSLELASAFYGATVEQIVPVSSARTAELVKVYENIFRSVNVALVNELAQLCDRMDLNVWEVLDAAFTKPFGIMPFYPGPGVGGHCIPLDPHYLEFKAREYQFQTRFVTLAGDVNRSMPRFVVEKAGRMLGAEKKALCGAKVLVLGVAYKKDIDDYRESPALDVMRLLQAQGAEVVFSDPHVRCIDEHGITQLSVPLSDALLAAADLVIICTEHSQTNYDWVVEKASRLLDTRNATRGVTRHREKIQLL